MSLKDPSTLPGRGEEHPPQQIMKKPSPVTTESQASAPAVKQKTSESGWSTLSYVFFGAATLITVGGLIYVGYELTKPMKKSRAKEVVKDEKNAEKSTLPTKKILPGKVTKEEDQEGNHLKQGNEFHEPIESLTPGMDDRHELVIERKQNQPIGIMLCPGENKQPGAFVLASVANEKLGLQVGAKLVEINGRVLDKEMSFKDIVLLLENSCCPSGKLCFKTNRILGERWKEAGAAKENGDDLFKKKQIDNAIKNYSTAVEKHPTNIIYWSNKASALYAKAKASPEKAAEIYAEVLTICKNIEELDLLQNFKKGHHIRGVILFELCRYDEAKNAFEAYLKLDNENKSVHARLKECEKAIAAAISRQKTKDQQEPGGIYIDVKKNSEIDTRMSYADMAKTPVKQQQNQSPSPVLVEKPPTAEVAQLESLGSKEQKPAQINVDVPNMKDIDETAGAVAEPTIKENENTIKSAGNGGNVSIKVGV